MSKFIATTPTHLILSARAVFLLAWTVSVALVTLGALAVRAALLTVGPASPAGTVIQWAAAIASATVLALVAHGCWAARRARR